MANTEIYNGQQADNKGLWSVPLCDRIPMPYSHSPRLRNHHGREDRKLKRQLKIFLDVAGLSHTWAHKQQRLYTWGQDIQNVPAPSSKSCQCLPRSCITHRDLRLSRWNPHPLYFLQEAPRWQGLCFSWIVHSFKATVPCAFSHINTFLSSWAFFVWSYSVLKLDTGSTSGTFCGLLSPNAWPPRKALFRSDSCLSSLQ